MMSRIRTLTPKLQREPSISFFFFYCFSYTTYNVILTLPSLPTLIKILTLDTLCYDKLVVLCKDCHVISRITWSVKVLQ